MKTILGISAALLLACSAAPASAQCFGGVCAIRSRTVVRAPLLLPRRIVTRQVNMVVPVASDWCVVGGRDPDGCVITSVSVSPVTVRRPALLPRRRIIRFK